jgi:putative Mg2+ transporter-C (MgtC) family protein
MLSRDGAVVGVTSAATIWVLAAIGVIISAGFLITAIKSAILIVLILYGVDFIEDKTALLSRGVHAKVMKLRKRN